MKKFLGNPTIGLINIVISAATIADIIWRYAMINPITATVLITATSVLFLVFVGLHIEKMVREPNVRWRGWWEYSLIAFSLRGVVGYLIGIPLVLLVVTTGVTIFVWLFGDIDLTFMETFYWIVQSAMNTL